MRQRRVDHGLIKNALYDGSMAPRAIWWWRWPPGRSHAGCSCCSPRHRVRRRYLLLGTDRSLFGVMWFQALVFSAVMVALLTTRLGQWLTPPLLRRRFLLSTPEAVYAIAGMDKDGLSAQVMFHIARNERRLDLRVSPALSDTPEKAQAWADIATSFSKEAYESGLDSAACTAVKAAAGDRRAPGGVGARPRALHRALKAGRSRPATGSCAR